MTTDELRALDIATSEALGLPETCHPTTDYEDFGRAVVVALTIFEWRVWARWGDQWDGVEDPRIAFCRAVVAAGKAQP